MYGQPQRIRIRFQKYDKGSKAYRDIAAFFGDAPVELANILSKKLSVDCEKGYHASCRGMFTIMVELLGFIVDLHAFCGCECHAESRKAQA